MDAVRAVRLLLAAGIAIVPACSIWAALDNPYKSDAPADGGAVDSAATSDGPADAGARDAAPGRRIVDAGFVPYAIAVHDDTLYALDNQARVYVARNASTRFTSLWTGDGGDTFLLQTNAMAASGAGVFWTVGTGVHFCSADGGGCAFIPSNNGPRAIAASGPVVAWIDSAGVRVCTMKTSGCALATLVASRGAASVAVGPNGTVAWTDGGKTIRLDDGEGGSAVTVRYDVSLLATDESSGNLYWAGLSGLGFVPFDGGMYPDPFRLTSLTQPIELFAARGLVYWSLRSGNGVVEYCRFDSDAGCTPKQLLNGLVPLTTTSDGIVSDSRAVLAIVSSDFTFFQPTLLAWPLPN